MWAPCFKHGSLLRNPHYRAKQYTEIWLWKHLTREIAYAATESWFIFWTFDQSFVSGAYSSALYFLLLFWVNNLHICLGALARVIVSPHYNFHTVITEEVFLIHLVDSFIFTFIWKQATLASPNNPLSVFRAISLKGLNWFSAVTGLQFFYFHLFPFIFFCLSSPNCLGLYSCQGGIMIAFHTWLAITKHWTQTVQ